MKPEEIDDATWAAAIWVFHEREYEPEPEDFPAVERIAYALLAERMGERRWQPADTAPIWIDGEGLPPYVLVFNGFHRGVGYRQQPNYPDDPEWVDEGGTFIEPPPTHWMLLPEPPALAIRNSGDGE